MLMRMLVIEAAIVGVAVVIVIVVTLFLQS
jgi:hypothetical protein